MTVQLSNKDYAIVDFTNDDEALKGIVKLGKSLTGEQNKVTAKVGANNYTLAVGIVRLGLKTSECEDQGITANRGMASKLQTVGRAVAYAARTTDDGQDDKLDSQVANLKRYYAHRVDDITAEGGTVGMGFLAIMQGLNGDDGDRRVEAIKAADVLFGGATTFYNIARGDVKHDADKVEDTPDDEGDEGDDEPNDEPDPITFIMAQLTTLRQYADKHGVTVGEVAGLFGQVFK